MCVSIGVPCGYLSGIERGSTPSRQSGASGPAYRGGVSEVLVVGAGPVGLTTAIELARRGVRCRIVERRSGPHDGTRACTIWQRTLELFDLIGLPVAQLLARGTTFRQRVYDIFGAHRVVLDVSEPDSAHPEPLIVSQEQTESLLIAHLASLGVPVEWDVTFDGHADADWVVVAEGARSALRERLGIGWAVSGFPGTQLVQVDARCAPDLPGDPAAVRLFLGPSGSVGSLPLPDGRHRLFISRPGDGVGDPPVEEIRDWARAMTGSPVSLSDPRYNWRAKLYNGIADRYREGRYLLVGDAAHAVVPVNAQGMNTGIQDAVNLGWKLAAVVMDKAPESLVDSYEAERRPVAVGLLEQTRRSYWAGTDPAPDPDTMVELLARNGKRRTLIGMGYPSSPLSAGSPVGSIRPGDRAPYPPGSPVSAGLAAAMRAGGWAVLAFGPSSSASAAAATVAAGRARLMPLVFADGAAYGLRPDEEGLYLVRPDGHVGFAGRLSDMDAAAAYLAALLG
jgi:2-polyprenyl-6-methoxyphenol hydroxylase-like FAD-dependent oxidoreductase